MGAKPGPNRLRAALSAGSGGLQERPFGGRRLPGGPAMAAVEAVQCLQLVGAHQLLAHVPRPGIGGEGVVEALAARLPPDLGPADPLPQPQQAGALAEGQVALVLPGHPRLLGAEGRREKKGEEGGQAQEEAEPHGGNPHSSAPVGARAADARTRLKIHLSGTLGCGGGRL